MGFLRRWFGRKATEDQAVIESGMADTDEVDLFAELNIVGEGYRQDQLAMVAGPKQHDGVQRHVGVTLRCEPDNPYDADAVRVESMGQHLAYVGREQAAVLGPAIEAKCGGCVEAVGLIVGGWDRGGGEEGHYGVRVWLSERQVDRLGVDVAQIQRRYRTPWPELRASRDGEVRVSPSQADLDAGRFGSEVTVTCEEHYQDAIGSTMPAGWESDRTWPLVVELGVVDANPHTGHGTRCVEVRLEDGRVVGYFTPKMSERHLPLVERLLTAGNRITAAATARQETKRSGTTWNLKVAIGAR